MTTRTLTSLLLPLCLVCACAVSLAGCSDGGNVKARQATVAPTSIRSAAVAPVRNNTQGLLLIPASGVTGVPGDYAALDQDPRRNVAYLFREMCGQFLSDKRYEVKPSDAYDETLNRFGEEQVVTELSMIQAAGTDAVLFVTINGWEVTEVRDRKSISMDADFELLRSDGARLWSHATGRRTIQLPTDNAATPYDLYIREFLKDCFDSLTPRPE